MEFNTKSEKQQEEQKVLGEDGFADQGNGQASALQNQRWKGKRMGIGYVDQVEIDERGQLKFIRRDNGDQDHQGRHARISVGEYKIFHVKLYKY